MAKQKEMRSEPEASEESLEPVDSSQELSPNLVAARKTEHDLLSAPQIGNFDIAVSYVLVNEGGYSNVKQDHGRATNYGITQDEYSAYLGRPASPADVKAMPLAAAKAIYRKHYWCDAFEAIEQGVATAIMDWCVLHGVTAAKTMAQASANKLGCHLDTDGKLGPKSIAGLNSLRPTYFIAQYQKDIIAWFMHRVEEAPDQRIFLKGWLARANRLSTLS